MKYQTRPAHRFAVAVEARARRSFLSGRLLQAQARQCWGSLHDALNRYLVLLDRDCHAIRPDLMGTICLRRRQCLIGCYFSARCWCYGSSTRAGCLAFLFQGPALALRRTISVEEPVAALRCSSVWCWKAILFCPRGTEITAAGPQRHEQNSKQKRAPFVRMNSPNKMALNSLRQLLVKGKNHPNSPAAVFTFAAASGRRKVPK